jgi:subtilisin family serine protease
VRCCSLDGRLSDDSVHGRADRPIASPDCVAPGTNIWAARSSIGHFHSLTGTAMSTPHVIGLCAQLLSANHALLPAQVKQRICDSCRLAVPLTVTDRYAQSSGLIQANIALEDLLTVPVPVPVVRPRGLQIVIIRTLCGRQLEIPVD